MCSTPRDLFHGCLAGIDAEFARQTAATAMTRRGPSPGLTPRSTATSGDPRRRSRLLMRDGPEARGGGPA
jgi:hypothetical protein